MHFGSCVAVLPAPQLPSERGPPAVRAATERPGVKLPSQIREPGRVAAKLQPFAGRLP